MLACGRTAWPATSLPKNLITAADYRRPTRRSATVAPRPPAAAPARGAGAHARRRLAPPGATTMGQTGIVGLGGASSCCRSRRTGVRPTGAQHSPVKKAR